MWSVCRRSTDISGSNNLWSQSPRLTHHDNPAHRVFRVNYTDYCKCQDCTQSKVDIIPNFDRPPYVRRQNDSVQRNRGQNDILSQRVQNIEMTLIPRRYSIDQFGEQTGTFKRYDAIDIEKEDDELTSQKQKKSSASPAKRVTFKRQIDDSVERNQNANTMKGKNFYKNRKSLGSNLSSSSFQIDRTTPLKEKLRSVAKRVSNATKSTTINSNRSAQARQSPHTGSGRQNFASKRSNENQSPGTSNLPLRAGGRIKQTLAKKKHETKAEGKYFYQRSYDDMINGKIERRGNSPYYKKTISFMAKNL